MTTAAAHTAAIAAVTGRQVLNTHLDWTVEITIALADGRRGRGASPRGETLSIYEDGSDDARLRPDDAVRLLARELSGAALDQQSLDAWLLERRGELGFAAVYATSTAFYEATRPGRTAGTPRILFNLLNGGLHAYTNPIVSDYHEFLLVPRSDDLGETVSGHLRLLEDTRRALTDVPTRLVGGNRVHDLGPEPNARAFALVEDLLARAGLTHLFGIMVDASAGDWFDGEVYRPSVTGGVLDRDALVDEWLRIMDRFDLEILEDPFAETDLEGWRALHERRPQRSGLYGDNLTSVQPAELEAKADLVDGVLVKPDQNGTVSGTLRFVELAREAELRIAASHRSIETDGPFLMHLATDIGADYIKIGPFSDFSSVVRTNALLRGSEA